MGESWSDLVALEYLHAHGLHRRQRGSRARTRPATARSGIRDYALDANPLNYSDVGFDLTGPEVHADGEIWNAVNYDAAPGAGEEVRRARSRRATRRCSCAAPTAARRHRAEPPLPAEQCPGNRRWIQIVFDAFLLQQGDTSMLDRPRRLPGRRPDALRRRQPGRRCGTRSPSAAWASRRATDTTEDDQPTPGFDSPLADEATVTFAATDAGARGRRRSTSAATRRARRRSPTPIRRRRSARPSSSWPAPTTCSCAAPGYGLRRFTLTVAAGQTLTQTFALTPNVASKSAGASAAGAGTNLDDLIDDTEVDDVGRHRRDRRQRHAAVGDDLVRRRASRCARSRSARCSTRATRTPTRAASPRCAGSRSRPATGGRRTARCRPRWQPLYTSPADAFPAIAPRPLAPDLTLRTFDVPEHGRDADPLHRAREPVHRRPGLPGRAGQRPAQRDRLRHRRPTRARSCTPPSSRCSARTSAADAIEGRPSGRPLR